MTWPKIDWAPGWPGQARNKVSVLVGETGLSAPAPEKVHREFGQRRSDPLRHGKVRRAALRTGQPKR